MASRDELRKQIDEIALVFETQWNIARSLQWLADQHAQCPCDELLAYLVAADSELARGQGVQRDSQYYLPAFPDKLIVIQAALADETETQSVSSQPWVLDDSQLELSAQFFPALPCMFGKYRVLRCIGRGGMAAIYQAEDGDRSVALKLPYRQHQGLKSFDERFQKEIRLLSSLSHPNIVPILESGLVDGLNYYTMPLIDGEGLHQKCTLDRFSSLSAAQAATYMWHATQAISFSHAQGVLHRDIKPSNILVDSHEHVWVVDFGLATVSDSHHSLTRDGQLLGTPTWMPPEQACGDYSKVDQRSDIYSLGATLYSLLTGRAPFTGATTGDLLANIQRQELIPPRHLCRHVPKPLQNIVLKCMEKLPGKRYSTAAELAGDLQAFLSGQPTTARAPSMPVRTYRWCRLYPRRTAYAAAILLIVALLAASTFAFRHVAHLQNQVAQSAQQRRDAALRSEAEQKRLREQAEIARLKANDAASYAESLQLRAEFAAAASQIRARRYDYADGLFQVAARQSMDTDWYVRNKFRRPHLIRAFSTGNWGHYDVAVDAAGKLLATAGREGDLAVWDIASEQLVKYCRLAERDPDKGIAWNRWRYHTGNTQGFTPTVASQFTSSVAWTQHGSLLASGVDGQLVEYFLDTVPARTIYRGEHPLYFVRTGAVGKNYFIVDARGNCKLLDANGVSQAEAALDCQPTWAGYAESHHAWIVASETGNLFYLNQDLRVIGRLSVGSQILDVRFLSTDPAHVLITSQGKPPGLYRITTNDTQLAFEREKSFVRQDDPNEPAFCRALVHSQTQRTVAIDDKGGLTTWKLDDDSSTMFGSLGAAKDIRHPYENEQQAFDLLERRPRSFLMPGSTGIVVIDCMGTFREYDLAVLSSVPTWQTLAVNAGPGARICADPNAPGNLWALDTRGVLRYISLTGEKVLCEQVAHTGGYADLQVRSNGEVLTAGADPAVRVWRLQKGAIQKTREFRHSLALVSVNFHEGRGLVASVDIEGHINLFDLTSGIIKHSFAAPSLSTTNLPVKVHTGRLAFSPSGKYLVAFSRWQECKCFDIERMMLTSASRINVAGAGGIDVIFSPSPEFEHRFLVSSLGSAANEIEQTTIPANINLLSSSDQPTAVDFAVSEDRQRVVRLGENGELIFCSAEHFIPLTSINTPTNSPSSLAITRGDSSLTVASAEGNLYTWMIEPLLLQADPERTLDCQYVPIDNAATLADLRFSTLGEPSMVADSSGHLNTLLIAGGSTAKSQLNRLYILNKQGAHWKLAPLHFEGHQDGPCEHANLYKSPEGKMFAVLRQGQISKGDYSGRVLIVHQTDDVWRTEIVHSEGNAGFCPFPVFSPEGTIQSLLHLDYEFQRLFAHSRDPATQTWKRSTLAGSLGMSTSGVQDAAGTTHLITRHLRGLDSSPPHKFMRIENSGKLHSEEAQGDQLRLNKRRQLFSFDSSSGEMWLKNQDLGWSLLGKLPFGRHIPRSSSLDHEDQMWWGVCLGQNLLVLRCDMSTLAVGQELKWQAYLGRLEHSFDKSTNCLCHRNTAGTLEIVLMQSEQPSLGIVEAAIREPLSN